MAPSQTWRTFLANRVGQLTLISPVTSPYASHDVIDFSGQPFCHPSSWNHEEFASHQRMVVNWCASLRRTSCGTRTVQDVREAMLIRNRTGRGPPTAWTRWRRPTLFAGSIVAATLDLCDEQRCLIMVAARVSPSSSVSSEASSFGLPCAQRRASSRGDRVLARYKFLASEAVARTSCLTTYPIGDKRFASSRPAFGIIRRVGYWSASICRPFPVSDTHPT